MFPFVDDHNLLLFASDGFLGAWRLRYSYGITYRDSIYLGSIGYPVNTNSDDFGLVYDSKTLKGFFTSNRKGGKGKDDIYFVKFKERLLGNSIQGIVFDYNSMKCLHNSTVYLYDLKGNIIDSTLTNEEGKFSFKPQKKYF